MRFLDTIRSVVRFGPIERDPVARRLGRCANIDDLRRVARRRLPRGVFDYIDGAAEDERTLARNQAGFADWQFRPRILSDVSTVDTTTTLLGRDLPLPLVLAPTGFTRIAHSHGELAVARAAARAGLPYCLSTLATRSIEEVAGVSAGPKWFQVYLWRDRGLVRDMLDRAAECGYEAAMLTVDTAVLGRRERDLRRGFTLPPTIGPATILDGMVHPAWTWDFVRAEPIRFANVTGRGVNDGGTAVSLASFTNSQFDPTMSWRDLEWLQSAWSKPLVLKGIQTVADAERALEAGVDGVAVSNHGGRQLDGAPSPIDLIEPIAQAVGGQLSVICDGGIRRGSDVVKALALGADACMIGRAYLYGLGAAGERGVDHVLDFLRAGVAQTMSLCGVTSIPAITRDLVELKPAR